MPRDTDAAIERAMIIGHCQSDAADIERIFDKLAEAVEELRGVPFVASETVELALASISQVADEVAADLDRELDDCHPSARGEVSIDWNEAGIVAMRRLYSDIKYRGRPAKRVTPVVAKPVAEVRS